MLVNFILEKLMLDEKESYEKVNRQWKVIPTVRWQGVGLRQGLRRTAADARKPP